MSPAPFDVGDAAVGVEIRFAADAMLGRLARWLRVLGFDTVYDPAVDDPELVALSAAEGRILLTRDRRLIQERRPAQALLITADAPLDQLHQVVGACDLPSPTELFTRCLVCNALLWDVSRDEAAAHLPEKARDLPGPIRRCPSCGRVYWPGSHTRRMREALRMALPEWLH